jgi:hypothetical protein
MTFAAKPRTPPTKPSIFEAKNAVCLKSQPRIRFWRKSSAKEALRVSEEVIHFKE